MKLRYICVVFSIITLFSPDLHAFKSGFVPFSMDDLATMQVEIPLKDKSQKTQTDYAINLIGNKIYDSQEAAQAHGVGFSRDNKFKKGDLVVVAHDNDGYVYGLIVQKDLQNFYIVQRDTEGEDFKLNVRPEQIGKLSTQVE